MTSASVNNIISNRKSKCFQLLFTQMNLCAWGAALKSLSVEAAHRNSMSNQAINCQRSSINGLLTCLSTSSRASLFKLCSVCDQLPADDDLDDFSGHCWFVLEREEGERGNE